MKAVISVKLNVSNTTCRAQLCVDPDFSSELINSSIINIGLYNIAKFTFNNLEENTKYYIRIIYPDGVPVDNYVGSFKTGQTGPHSFKFAFASCSWSNNTDASNQQIYDRIVEKANNGLIDFFVHMGDMHYSDIAQNDENLFQAAYDRVFSAPRQNNCWKNLPMFYMWDDHDFGPNDTDKNSPSRAAAISAYRRRVPFLSLGSKRNTDSPYFSFIRGRVRFIFTDVRSERVGKGVFNSEDINQKIFSDEQKIWLFSEMLAAKYSKQAIVWVNTKPWISSIENGKDDWGGYHSSRMDIVNFIEKHNLKNRIVILSGDMHALAYDDGSSPNNYGKLKVCHAGPLDQESRVKGGPYLIPAITDDGGTGWSTQYGIIEINDNGSCGINVRFKGIVVNKSNFTESIPINVNFNLEVSCPIIPINEISSSSSSSSSSLTTGCQINSFQSAVTTVNIPIMTPTIVNKTNTASKYGNIVIVDPGAFYFKPGFPFVFVNNFSSMVILDGNQMGSSFNDNDIINFFPNNGISNNFINQRLDTSLDYQVNVVGTPYSDSTTNQALLVRCVQSSSSSSWDGTTWDLNIEITSPNQTFTVRLPQGGPNIRIDWGDGSTPQLYTTTGNKTRTYSNPGVYTVKINGSFNNNGVIEFGTSTQERARIISTSPVPFIPNLIYLSLGDSSIESIPEGFFDNAASSIFSLTSVFINCLLLRNIPENLFVPFYNKNLDFIGTFRGCKSLKNIPANLFASNTLTTSFAQCFFQCELLSEIPPNLFVNNTEVTDFGSCFNGTSILSIPSNLFVNNTKVTNFSSCFGQCLKLISIPENLFFNNVEVTTFENLFFGCRDLTSIPPNLFTNNVKATNFGSCFLNCLSINSIPENLFINNTKATNFRFCFNGVSISSIPSNIFINNREVNTFESCFAGINTINSLPTNLFINNTGVTNFKDCFARSNLITSVPANLFATNTGVTTFENCFTSTLMTTSYSNLLINMASNSEQRRNDVLFGAGNSKYNTAGQSAKAVLTGKNWVFTDGGLDISYIEGFYAYSPISPAEACTNMTLTSLYFRDDCFPETAGCLLYSDINGTSFPPNGFYKDLLLGTVVGAIPKWLEIVNGAVVQTGLCNFNEGLILNNFLYAEIPEVVEFKNSSSSPLNLTNWKMISHTPNTFGCPQVAAQTFIFPNIILNPNQTIKIYSAYGTQPPNDGLLWLSTTVWNNQGDVLSLYDNNNQTVMTVTYGTCLNTWP
jgi:hypothetical protein